MFCACLPFNPQLRKYLQPCYKDTRKSVKQNSVVRRICLSDACHTICRWKLYSLVLFEVKTKGILFTLNSSIYHLLSVSSSQLTYKATWLLLHKLQNSNLKCFY